VNIENYFCTITKMLETHAGRELKQSVNAWVFAEPQSKTCPVEAAAGWKLLGCRAE
jgi:hypothetical protein